MTTLFIDTTNNQEIVISLRIGDKSFSKKREVDKTKSQAVLPMVDELLQKHKLELSDIEGIEVNVGPGSFTGIRVGISIAQTLSTFLKIPINGKKSGTLIDAVYS